ncbi:methyl-accepting chemotaxis protein [Caminicella sporogenes DSM 14501]|uniref:Methyl-accepting chemotaxis protein n=1 Tax=Caminicella sporogenes DSM 14501 TaxID=1121266 RepID=A0A1M6Q4H5_9FIRM|nr:methyl-accepting chemotaxis protein [Caminicella sporogenes]RKD23571.1 hypothetical protein BET04_04020 [Caminicella sporogenes]SHK15132.1 methyl-accepting chemotaxis protein [Caminicella sporogenes DSM 14501]
MIKTENLKKGTNQNKKEKKTGKLKNSKFNKKIGLQISSIIVIILLISISSIGVINYFKDKSNIVERAKHDNYTMAMALSSQVDMYVRSTADILKTVVNSIDFQSMDETMKTITLSKIISKNRQIKNLCMTDREGNVLATTYSLRDRGKNYKDKAWFKEAIKGKIYVSNAFIDKTTNTPIITIAHPIENRVGSEIGVISADLKLDQLYYLVKDIKIGKTGLAYIVDGEGIIIAHKQFNTKVMTRYDAKKIKGVANLLNKGNGSDIYLNTEGKKVVGGYYRAPFTNWGVIVEKDYDEVLLETKKAFKRTILISLVFILFGIVLSPFFTKKFTKPILNMTEVANKLKEGDLTQRVRVDCKNELGILQSALNEMSERFTLLIKNINKTVDDLNTSSMQLEESTVMSSKASIQISNIIEEVAKNTEKQIESVTDAEATIEEMAASLKNAADNSMEILKASNHASNLAEVGAKDINDIVETMESIKKVVLDSSKLIGNLNNHIKEIGNIVGFIKEISEQTNLLALNASIEAARAGEHGKGFTVVANEVKKLADESSRASKNIEELINKIQNESKKIIISMEGSIERVKTGTEVISNTTKSFKEIISETQSVAKEIEDFAATMEQLSSGMDVVEDAVQQVVDLSQTTASGTQEVLSNVQEQEAAIHNIVELVCTLGDMSAQLQNIVKKFKM